MKIAYNICPVVAVSLMSTIAANPITNAQSIGVYNRQFREFYFIKLCLN